MTCPDLVLLFSNISKEIALSSCHLSIVILSVFAHAFSSVFFPWKYLKWELSSYIANNSKKALTDITFHQNCSHFGADVLTKLKAVQPGFFCQCERRLVVHEGVGQILQLEPELLIRCIFNIVTTKGVKSSLPLKERKETICNELQCSFTFGFSLWPMVRAIYSGHFQQYFTQFWPS